MDLLKGSLITTMLLLSGCDGSGFFQPTFVGPNAGNEQISTECKLLESSTELLEGSETKLKGRILAGCPGKFRNTKVSDAQKKASNDVLTDYPASTALRKRGTEYEIAYNRLISKGVPVRVALLLVDDPNFVRLGKILLS